METLHPASRQSVGLPPITHLDNDKVKREEAEYQRKHSAPAMVSPLHPFPPPLHSYSNHQSSSASSLPGPSGGLLSPPESRRTSENDKEQRLPARQSLPSIHEALGPEPPLPYPAHAPSAPASAQRPFFPPSSTAPQPDSRTRTFSVDHINQGPPNPYSQPQSPFIAKPASTAGPPASTHAPADATARSSFPPSQPSSRLPTLHPIRTTQSPPVPESRPNPPYSAYSHPPTANTYEPRGPHSAGPVNSQHSYQPPSARYPLSAPAPSASSSGPPPSATFSAPPRYPPPYNSDFERPDEKKRPMGEAVKRKLDVFDLEVTLNEVAECAGRILEFSRGYGQKAQQNQRTGLTAECMPRLEEVEDMGKLQYAIGQSLENMKEIIRSHQQVAIAEAPSHYRPVNGYDPGGRPPYHEDSKANSPFTSIDNKRRKGRAAPPGRCHSCNRAETPEWRRGPDGARTLCNACGLHYAKLTRKMANSKQAMASSTLRPKALGEGSSNA